MREQLVRAAAEVDALLAPWLDAARAPDRRRVVAIGGESGSGKTTIAAALLAGLSSRGARAIVLSMDDYYHLPPAKNDAARARDLSRVGPPEIDLARVARLIDAFVGGAGELSVRRLRPARDGFDDGVPLPCVDASVLLVEGTFVLAVDAAARATARVFIERDYRDTEAGRAARQRDVLDDVMQQVLAIEHEQVRSHRHRADVLLDRDLRVRLVTTLPSSLTP